MSQPQARSIRKPRTDDRLLWDLILSNIGYSAVLVAYDLKIFPLLAEEPRTLTGVCDALQLAQRPAQALLSTCVAHGLLQQQGEQYALSPVAEEYLLTSSPTYFGGLLDMLITNDSLFSSFENMKKAVLTNSSQAYGGEAVFKSHEEQIARARVFTYGMHCHSIGAAQVWPEVIDLSRNLLMLDIGGGSGAHAIGAVQRWPELQAIVYDLPPICQIAEEFAVQYGAQDRVTTHSGDMWNDSFPSADVHFYGDIYHDWPPEKCRFLTQKSFESLPSDGRIIIHEMLYNDQKTGPFTAAAYNDFMLLCTEGQQYSGNELTNMLKEAGFTNIEIQPTFGYWSILTGCKP
jgi:hypothetical protein